MHYVRIPRRGQGVESPLGNHKRLYVSFKYWFRLRSRSNLFSWEVRTTHVKYLMIK